jgi:hypothetical protein
MLYLKLKKKIACGNIAAGWNANTYLDKSSFRLEMLLILAPLIPKLFNPHIKDFQDFNLVSKKNQHGTTIKPKKKKRKTDDRANKNSR